MGEAPADQEERDELEVVGDTLVFLARSLAEHPDKVSVDVIPGDTSVFKLHVDPEDLGRIIGRGGRTARAIRQVAKAAAAKCGIHVFIEIAG
ncbi:MAG: KH domain-containing protein [Actinomycetota bacterium]|nr:KH domain-containing protein [Actinomycetota bacterium]